MSISGGFARDQLLHHFVLVSVNFSEARGTLQNKGETSLVGSLFSYILEDAARRRHPPSILLSTYYYLVYDYN